MKRVFAGACLIAASQSREFLVQKFPLAESEPVLVWGAVRVVHGVDQSGCQRFSELLEIGAQ